MRAPRSPRKRLSIGFKRGSARARKPTTKGNPMALIPEPLKQQLLENGRTNWQLSNLDKDTIDFNPVVKLFDPCSAGNWLLTELDPEGDDLAFGLCDLGTGFPELGSVRISELESHKGRLGIGIERDVHFQADKTLGAYAADAHARGHINA
jgi:hypothetical protein